jgi:hypothetical protein
MKEERVSKSEGDLLQQLRQEIRILKQEHVAQLRNQDLVTQKQLKQEQLKQEQLKQRLTMQEKQHKKEIEAQHERTKKDLVGKEQVLIEHIQRASKQQDLVDKERAHRINNERAYKEQSKHLDRAHKERKMQLQQSLQQLQAEHERTKTVLTSSERAHKEQTKQLARAHKEREEETDRAQRLQTELTALKEPEETLVFSLPTEHVQSLEDLELARLGDLIRSERSRRDQAKSSSLDLSPLLYFNPYFLITLSITLSSVCVHAGFSSCSGWESKRTGRRPI